MMRSKEVPLALLIEDMSIYPRHAVDAGHVAHLARAIRAGAALPQPVVDQASMRIVDGWHRIRAWRHILGESGTIRVELRQYATHADLIADAIWLNAAHGRKLDRIDQVRCIVLAEQAGIDSARVAVLLRVTVDEVEKLSVRVAEAPAGSDGTIPGTNLVPLKVSARHFTEMSKEQAAAHQGQPGTHHLLLVRQLSNAIQANLVNRGNQRLMSGLRELYEVLGNYLSSTPDEEAV